MPGGQLRRRFETELVAQQAPEIVIHPQGLDRAARPRQRGHEQRPGPLAQGLLVGQRAELGDESVGDARGQSPLGAPLHGPDAQLFEADGLGAAVVELIELRVRGTLPAREHGANGVGDVGSGAVGV